MLGQSPTKKDGKPLDNGAKELTQAPYQLPNDECKKLFKAVQTDFQTAWLLQRKPFNEFDGYSLLDRTRLDQETFGAFVGVEYLPKHKQWRFRGRQNTARNKIVSILGQVIAGMLFPFVNAKNERNELDKDAARVMSILVEDALKKANYEWKFLSFALTALTNPAIIVQTEYVEAIQRIKQKLKSGKYEVKEVVDELMSGIMLYAIPIDEILFGDFHFGAGNMQAAPFIMRQRRISYDYARSIYAGKYKIDGKDQFDFVQAGKTHWIDGDQGDTLFQVEYTEADANFVQELTVWYRGEDLQVTFVGGVFMGNEKNVYNSNPFEHRRMILAGKEWFTVPVYPFAMAGFELIDPTGRFIWFKSAANKEYWDDQKLNLMSRLIVDGTHLDVLKPVFYSGIGKFDSSVMVPGATANLGKDAKLDAYSLGPNLAAAYNVVTKANEELSESTQDKIMGGVTEPGVTATQSVIAQRQARLLLGNFSLMMAFIVQKIGELVVDCVIQHTTIGQLDTSVPEALSMRYKTILVNTKDRGKNVTNRIIFSDSMMDKKMTAGDKKKYEYGLLEKAGGVESDQRIHEVNPYQFARMTYTLQVDADKMIQRSMGSDRTEKELAFEKMMDPRVMPFIDPKAVARDFVIDEYSDGDPERYVRKDNPAEGMEAMFGMGMQPQKKPVGASSLPQPIKTL